MSYQREFSHRLRAGLVGIGSHAYRNILPVMNFLPVQLVAVCNRSNIELAQLTAAQYGCKSYQKPEEMYEKENLDCVFICVSPEAPISCNPGSSDRLTRMGRKTCRHE